MYQQKKPNLVITTYILRSLDRLIDDTDCILIQRFSNSEKCFELNRFQGIYGNYNIFILS